MQVQKGVAAIIASAPQTKWPSANLTQPEVHLNVHVSKPTHSPTVSSFCGLSSPTLAVDVGIRNSGGFSIASVLNDSSAPGNSLTNLLSTSSTWHSTSQDTSANSSSGWLLNHISHNMIHISILYQEHLSLLVTLSVLCLCPSIQNTPRPSNIDAMNYTSHVTMPLSWSYLPGYWSCTTRRNRLPHYVKNSHTTTIWSIAPYLLPDILRLCLLVIILWLMILLWFPGVWFWFLLGFVCWLPDYMLVFWLYSVSWFQIICPSFSFTCNCSLLSCLT